jgi:hypothetical protein
MATALEGGERSASRPGRSLPPWKTRYPLYRRLDGPQGRSGQVRKISFPQGLDLRNVQLVASRYTDWATRPTKYKIILYKISCSLWTLVRPIHVISVSDNRSCNEKKVKYSQCLFHCLLQVFHESNTTKQTYITELRHNVQITEIVSLKFTDSSTTFAFPFTFLIDKLL